MQRPQVRIYGNDHVRPSVQRDFDDLVVFRIAAFAFAFLTPRIRAYSSADTTTASSPFLRQILTGSCWTASSRAPKRLRAAVMVIVLMCRLSAESNRAKIAKAANDGPRACRTIAGLSRLPGFARLDSRGRLSPHGLGPFLPSVSRAGRHRFAMIGVAVVGF